MANFRFLSNQPAIVSGYFGRSDTPDGLARDQSGGIIPPPQEAINALLQGLSSGQIVTDSPQGEQIATSYGYSPAVASDPSRFLNAAAGGANMADLTFGQIPGTPANTQPTVAMRQLLQQALAADASSRLAYQQAAQSNKIGDATMALQQKTQADNLAQQARAMDMQASQFAQTFGLQQEESVFRRELATQQQQLETQKFGLSAELGRGELALKGQAQGLAEAQYTTELASKPQNLIQSALWQGNRSSQFTPTSTAFGGNANTPLGQASQGGYGQMAVPYAGVVSALNSGQAVPRYGMSLGAGQVTTLDALQNEQGFRLNPSNMTLPSLKSVLGNETDAAFLGSTLQVQSQDPASFMQGAQAGMPKQTVSLRRAY